jgi:hypothetical protein
MPTFEEIGEKVWRKRQADPDVETPAEVEVQASADGRTRLMPDLVTDSLDEIVGPAYARWNAPKETNHGD